MDGGTLPLLYFQVLIHQQQRKPEVANRFDGTVTDATGGKLT